MQNEANLNWGEGIDPYLKALSANVQGEGEKTVMQVVFEIAEQLLTKIRTDRPFNRETYSTYLDYTHGLVKRCEDDLQTLGKQRDKFNDRVTGDQIAELDLLERTFDASLPVMMIRCNASEQEVKNKREALAKAEHDHEKNLAELRELSRVLQAKGEGEEEEREEERSTPAAPPPAPIYNKGKTKVSRDEK